MGNPESRACLYVETSVWNTIKYPGGEKLIGALAKSFHLVYSDEVVHEIAATSEAGLRNRLLDALTRFGALRLIVEGDEANPNVVGRADNPRCIGTRCQGSVPGFIALMQKFYGARSSESFAEIAETMQADIERVWGGLTSEGQAKARDVLAELKTWSEKLTAAHSAGAGFNGRTMLQQVVGVKLSQIAEQKIRPPGIIDQLWQLLQPKLDQLTGGKVTKEQFFGTEGHPEVRGTTANATTFDRCLSMYVHLNFIGFAADKQLTDEDRIMGSVRDAYHVARATYCQGLITNDLRLHRKAVAIYEHLGRGIAILSSVDDDGFSLSQTW